MEKLCTKCKNVLPLDKFFKSAANKDGLAFYCKDCCYSFRGKNHLFISGRVLKETPEEVRIQRKIRVRLDRALRTYLDKKGAKHSIHLDFGPQELKNHIKSLLDEKIKWDNRGDYWIVEHIIPTCFYDLKNIKERKMCYDLSNLRPFPVLDNLTKSDLLPNGERARYYRNLGPEKFKLFFCESGEELSINKFVIINNKFSLYYNFRGQIIKIRENLATVRIRTEKTNFIEDEFKIKDLSPIVLLKV